MKRSSAIYRRRLASGLVLLVIGSVTLVARAQQSPAEAPAAQQPPATPVTPTESPAALDDQLLEDLVPPAQDAATAPEGSSAAGEDLGKPPEDKPLDGVLGHMRSAHARLRAGNTSAETQQEQQRAADQLALLIADVQQRMQQSGMQRERTTAMSDNADAEAPNGTEQPEEANPSGRSGGGPQSAAEQAARARAAREKAWGHLPERVRQQLQSAAIERFLPKYEDLIEQYYQRLAEDAEVPRTSDAPAP